MNEQKIEDIDDLNELEDLRKEYFEDQRFKELGRVCERALKIKPDDYDFSLYLAFALFETKQYGRAIHLSDKILHERYSASTLLILSQCYLRIGSYTKAIEVIEDFLDEHSENPLYNYLLGLAYRERSKQDNDFSVKYIRQAKLLEPKIEAHRAIKEFLEFFQ